MKPEAQAGGLPPQSPTPVEHIFKTASSEKNYRIHAWHID
jgi:hypothetical protein